MTTWAWIAVGSSALTLVILAAAALWPAVEYLYLMWKGKDDGR